MPSISRPRGLPFAHPRRLCREPLAWAAWRSMEPLAFGDSLVGQRLRASCREIVGSTLFWYRPVLCELNAVPDPASSGPPGDVETGSAFFHDLKIMSKGSHTTTWECSRLGCLGKCCGYGGMRTPAFAVRAGRDIQPARQDGSLGPGNSAAGFVLSFVADLGHWQTGAPPEGQHIVLRPSQLRCWSIGVASNCQLHLFCEAPRQ